MSGNWQYWSNLWGVTHSLLLVGSRLRLLVVVLCFCSYVQVPRDMGNYFVGYFHGEEKWWKALFYAIMYKIVAA